MPKLKQAVIQTVYQSLDNPWFSTSDFDVRFPDEGAQYVHIVFRHDQNYFFSMSEERPVVTGIAALSSTLDRELTPHTKESPGDFKALEWKEHHSFHEALRRIGPWCENLYEELRSKSPALRELEGLRQMLEQHFAEHEVADPDAPFTAQELETLVERFDKLQERLSELEAEHIITRQELASAQADIKTMQESAQALPKGMWSKLAKNRLFSLFTKVAKSAEGRSFMLEAAKKFLLPGPN